MQMYFMSKDNISVSYSSLTFLVIAGVYQVVMIGYAGLMFLLRGAMIAQNLKGIVILLVCGIIIGIGIISALVLAVFSNRVVKAVMGCLLKIAHKLHIVKNLEGASAKVDTFVHDYKVGAAHIRKNPLVLLKMLAYTALQLTVLFSIPFFVYRSFGLSSFSMLDVIAMQAILTLSVSALPLPGAVGLSEGGFMIMFRLFFAPGILLPAMMLSRGISFYLFVAISGVVTLAAYLKLRTKQKGAKRHGQLVSAGQCRKAVCGSCERVEHVDL